MPGSAIELAEDIHEWAEKTGSLYGYSAEPATPRPRLAAVLPSEDAAASLRAERLINKAEITGVLFDEDRSVVTVLTKGHIGPRQMTSLPRAADGITVNWIGSAQPTQNPPPLPPPPMPP